MRERALGQTLIAIEHRDTIVVISPLERPNPALIASVGRAGGLGVLDLGHDKVAALTALSLTVELFEGPFGVRIHDTFPLAIGDLPSSVDTLIVTEPRLAGRWLDGEHLGTRILVEATSFREGRQAMHDGVDGIVVRGTEAGGRIGTETSLILLQRLIAEIDLPIWVAGGVGIHSAGALLAGGAKGVVLDDQLVLIDEAGLEPSLTTLLQNMDGSDTTIVDGRRILHRHKRSDFRGALANPDLTPPIGQHGAFAACFASRWQSAGAAVHGLRREIRSHLVKAQAAQPLARFSPLAQSLNIEYPIVQGPMTRVSDQPAFAAAVAQAGAMPTIALALLSRDEAKKLMEETAARLDGRPWGVGILGFVPKDLRDQQLEAVKAIQPSLAVIAGGKPRQALRLEADGIQAFMHVPSPKLLRYFLDAGVRRFVFEGSECGGHVGPRSSLVLWESQVEELLKHDCLADVSILFAGGIHDARSAAIASVLGAPLFSRGAKIGVLLGTAYLFCKEAVRTGAIVQSYQDAALGCTTTSLVTSAPGHSIQCAQSPFVDAFNQNRDDLASSGMTSHDVATTLDIFTLGRLRIAAKGVAHDTHDARSVSTADQQRDGMYMMGQVATLRKEPISIDELHVDISDGSSRYLRSHRLSPKSGPDRTSDARPTNVAIAIVGMASIFPDAPDLDSFWRNIVAGSIAISEVPRERWDTSLYYDSEAQLKGIGHKSPSKWGGFLPRIAFDALQYGVPPNTLSTIDSVQLLALHVADRAMDDAGYGRGPHKDFDRDRVAVIFGTGGGTDLLSAHSFRALAPQFLGAVPDFLECQLPVLTEDSFPGVLPSVIAGRIANRLDLRGPNYTIDAACASSLAALDAGVKELVLGSSDMVLSGAADVHNGIIDYLLFSAVRALSPTGRCSAFDSKADGIVLGEGVACVVLKRLEDALRDGDRTYAVIEGIGAASDGRSLGLTAPSAEGQRRAVVRGYEQSNRLPADVQLMEAHGTGTVVGDRTELQVLTDVLTECRARPGACALGSVKAQIGHTKCAAGMAGLIKVAKSLYHGVIPPTPHLDTPNAGYEEKSSPFAFRSSATPWPEPERLAGLSSFGFGGTNFHLVARSARLSEQSEALFGINTWLHEALFFRGTRPDTLRLLDKLEAYLHRVMQQCHEDPPEWRFPSLLRDLALTAWNHGTGTIQAAIISSGLHDLQAKLAETRFILSTDSQQGHSKDIFVAEESSNADPQVALLFPGQGSQNLRMLEDLFVTFPFLRNRLRTSRDLVDIFYPRTTFLDEDNRRQRARIIETDVAQPGLGMVELAAADLMAFVGIRAAFLGGHSYGELSALAVAGAISEGDLHRISVARACAILHAVENEPGAMMAIASDASAAEALLSGSVDIVVANDNSPEQVVLSGSDDAISRTLIVAKEHGITAGRIQAACAFHSPRLRRASEDFEHTLGNFSISEPNLPVWSNTSAQIYPSGAAEIRALLADQISKPVRFREQIEAMYSAGARAFIEAGPGSILTRLTDSCLRGRQHLAVGIDAPGEDGVLTFLRMLGRLATFGVPIDAAPIFLGRAKEVDLESGPPPPAKWVVDGQMVRQLDGSPLSGGLLPATVFGGRQNTPPPEQSVPSPKAIGGSACNAELDTSAIVHDYLATVRTTLNSAEGVVLKALDVGARALDPRPLISESALPISQAVPAVATGPMKPSEDRGAFAMDSQSLRDFVVGVVSDRTGYPRDMLDPTLDLEAELSIDSIKRLEIVAELVRDLGLEDNDYDNVDDDTVEALAAMKTIDEMVSWLGGVTATDMSKVSSPFVDPSLAIDESRPAIGQSDSSIPPRAVRFVPRNVAVKLTPELPNRDISGHFVAVTSRGDIIAAELASVLRGYGAEVVLVNDPAPLPQGRSIDALIHLSELSSEKGCGAEGFFLAAKAAVVAGASFILGASAMGGDFGEAVAEVQSLSTRKILSHQIGMRGVAKALNHEIPRVRCKLVDLSEIANPISAAKELVDEFVLGWDYPEVGRQGHERITVVAERADIQPLPSEPLLDSDAVVVITGGGRGITARVALGIAKEWRCKLVIAGRTTEPIEVEPDHTSIAGNQVSLRRVLIEDGFGPPQIIDAEVKRLVSVRELRSNLAELRKIASSVEYVCIDSRRPTDVEALISSTYDRYGRIDGAIHGSGVLELVSLLEKDTDSFRRVFETKVSGGLALASSLKDDVRFVVMFASAAGFFGAPRSVDYCAANDALGSIARHLNQRIRGRAVAIDWGPWTGGGMIDPFLERELLRRGIGSLEPEDAVQTLLRELANEHGEPEVILMRALPESFHFRQEQ